MILVDSSVWSIVLRRRSRDRNASEQAVYFAWREQVISGEAAIVGIIRQEVLSGIASKERFRQIQGQLDAVYELGLDHSVWDQAAQFYSLCAGRGVSPGAVDMTICAAAYLNGCDIFAIDPDFDRYAKVLPISLHAWE